MQKIHTTRTSKLEVGKLLTCISDAICEDGVFDDTIPGGLPFFRESLLPSPFNSNTLLKLYLLSLPVRMGFFKSNDLTLP